MTQYDSPEIDQQSQDRALIIDLDPLHQGSRAVPAQFALPVCTT